MASDGRGSVSLLGLMLLAVLVDDAVAAGIVKNCGRGVPGLKMLMSGIDIMTVDLVPIQKKYRTHTGFKASVIDFTCTHGYKTRYNDQEYVKYDQVSAILLGVIGPTLDDRSK